MMSKIEIFKNPLAVIQLYKKQPVQKIGPCLAQIRRGAPECIFPPSMQRESISI